MVCLKLVLKVVSNPVNLHSPTEGFDRTVGVERRARDGRTRRVATRCMMDIVKGTGKEELGKEMGKWGNGEMGRWMGRDYP